MLIFVCKSKENFLDVIQNGLKCTESDEFEENCLGPSSQGIHLCKLLELALLNEYVKNRQVVYFVLVDVSLSVLIHFAFINFRTTLLSCLFKFVCFGSRMNLIKPGNNRDMGLDPSKSYHVTQSILNEKDSFKKRLICSLVRLFFI